MAVPYIAGPSTTATILLLVGPYPDRWAEWLLALAIASMANACILLPAARLVPVLGKRVLCAIE